MKLIPNCLVSVLVMKHWSGINNDSYLDTPIGSVERSKYPKRLSCLSMCEEWEQLPGCCPLQLLVVKHS